MTKEEVMSKLVDGGFEALAADLDVAQDLHVQYFEVVDAIVQSTEFTAKDYQWNDGPLLNVFPSEAIAAACAAANAETVKNGSVPESAIGKGQVPNAPADVRPAPVLPPALSKAVAADAEAVEAVDVAPQGLKG
jgi:hypothetical protein